MSVLTEISAPHVIKTQRQFKVTGIAGMPLSAIAFLILTAAVSLFQSHYRFINGDDLLELWSDKASTIGKVLHTQSSFPLVIDPFFYHALTFLGVRAFGINQFALRLPSLLGFLLMQVCLFYFVRRIASERAAVFALAFPAITGAFGYTVQIRPYGIWLGLFGLAMLCWQTATRRGSHRTWPLVLLALSIAAAINTHYYGVLLLVPLCAAELVRAIVRKRFDFPVLVSIGVGMAGVLFLLPFLKGAGEFRSHYQATAVPYHVIPQAYNFILLGLGAFNGNTNHLLQAGLILCSALIAWACFHQLHHKTLLVPSAEWVFLITTAAMPFIGFLLGRFVTHAMEPRYVLGSILGISAILAIALDPLLRRDAVGLIILVALFAAFTCKGALRIRAEQTSARDTRSSLLLSPGIMAAIMASPTKLLYTQDIDLFGFVQFQELQADVVPHLALVYSSDEEMRWKYSDTASRIALHLSSIKHYPILPYEGLKMQPGEHIFLLNQGGWNWIEQAFAAEHVHMKSLGSFLGCEVVAVRFP